MLYNVTLTESVSYACNRYILRRYGQMSFKNQNVDSVVSNQNVDSEIENFCNFFILYSFSIAFSPSRFHAFAYIFFRLLMRTSISFVL